MPEDILDLLSGLGTMQSEEKMQRYQIRRRMPQPNTSPAKYGHSLVPEKASPHHPIKHTHARRCELSQARPPRPPSVPVPSGFPRGVSEIQSDRPSTYARRDPPPGTPGGRTPPC